MTYQEYQKDSCVYMIGQEIDSVFIVLKGRLQEQLKNPEINNWDYAISVFRVLQEWKANQWDPKAQKAFLLHHVKNKLKKDTTTLVNLIKNNANF